MSNATMNATQNVVTADNYAPAVNVLNWFLISATVVAVVARTGFKAVLQGIKGDDSLIFVSLALAIGSCITTSLATQHGLGQPSNLLSTDELNALQGTLYAGELLIVPSITASRLSIHVLLRSFAMTQLHKNLNFALMCATVLWGISSLFVIGFQCRLPPAWKIFETDHCIDQPAFLNWFAISNIILETALLGVLSAIVAAVQIPWKKQLLVIVCFFPRVTVIMASIAYVSLLDKLPVPVDPSMDWWPLVVTAQFMQDLSIITSCTPYLKPFFISMQSGMIRNDDLRRRGREGDYGYVGNSSARSWGKRNWPRASYAPTSQASKASSGRKEWRDSNRIKVQTEFEIIEEN